MDGDVNVVGAEGAEGRRPEGVLTWGWETGDDAAEVAAGLELNADSAFWGCRLSRGRSGRIWRGWWRMVYC
jgi:hypothetical protein